MKTAFYLKSARLDALTIRLNSTNLDEIRNQLSEKNDKFQIFKNKPLVLDASPINHPNELNIQEIVDAFKQHEFHVIGMRHNDRDWSDVAKSAQILWLPENKPNTAEPTPTEISDESPIPSNEEANEASHNHSTEQPQITARPTLVISTPVRTGQQVYAEKSDLIVLGMVSEGAEVIADGNIHIYAPLRGRALAGESGDKNARIFVQSMQAELVSIAGIYRVFEQDLPAHLHKQAVQIELQDDRLSVSAINAQ